MKKYFQCHYRRATRNFSGQGRFRETYIYYILNNKFNIRMDIIRAFLSKIRALFFDF